MPRAVIVKTQNFMFGEVSACNGAALLLNPPIPYPVTCYPLPFCLVLPVQCEVDAATLARDYRPPQECEIPNRLFGLDLLLYEKSSVEAPSTRRWLTKKQQTLGLFSVGDSQSYSCIR